MENEATTLPSRQIADGLHYVVLADLADSTDYMKRMGNDAGINRLNAFIGAAKEALAHSKPNNSGEFIKASGDAVLLVFKYFPDVVQWLLEFQGSLTFAWRHDKPLTARIWVHAGEITFRNGDAHGLAINQVFKVEARAKRKTRVGELVLTHVARDVADPVLFPKQCVLMPCGKVKLAGHPSISLHRLVVKADIAFMIDKQRKDKTRSF